MNTFLKTGLHTLFLYSVILFTSTSCCNCDKISKRDASKSEVVDELKYSTISVSISPDRIFYLDNKEIESDSLIELIQVEIDKIGNKEEVTLIIKSDKDVPIEDVVKVMDAAYKLEIKAILATDPNAD